LPSVQLVRSSSVGGAAGSAGTTIAIGVSAPLLVPGADHGDVRDRRVSGQHVLDLGAVDVLPARDDHVLLAVDDVQEAFVVGADQVAGVEPAAGERVLGGGRIVQ
jgi:hypothetical protein